MLKDRINKYNMTKINPHTEVGKNQIMLYIVTHSLENQVTRSMIDI